MKNRTQAFLYLNQFIADALRPMLGNEPSAIHLLDLGCGVGGTATWLAQTLGIRITGVTLSIEQVQLAKARAQQLGLSAQVNFVLGDFSTPLHLPPAHAACAIESFVHAENAKTFFEMVARHIQPGGRLIICDDFLNPPHNSRALWWIKRFTQGWHINNLLTTHSAIALAEASGFRLVEKRDLSPWVQSFNPLLLWLVTTMTYIPLRWAYWKNLTGGAALQVCVKREWTTYQAITLEKLAN
ncbi:MAG: methyltransferase domain-containing protein [Gammaproteobacteria bacterium]|nr:methyltransferase domain-containing protein [Gammaproteobacteria bacterium]